MDLSYAHGMLRVLQLTDRRFETPEWQHRVALAAMREPWGRRVSRRLSPLRRSARGTVTVASQVAVPQREGC